MKTMRLFKKSAAPGLGKSWGMALLFSLFGLAVAMAQQPAYIVSGNNTYKALQLSVNSISNGTLLQLGNRNAGNAAMNDRQLWYYDGPTQTIRLYAHPEKCLSRKNQQLAGDPIQLRDCANQDASISPLQHWALEDGRIKLSAHKSMCVSLKNSDFNAGNPVIMAECTGNGTYQRWAFQEQSQLLEADGQLHRINSPGETYLDVAIPDPCPYSYLYLKARGGDGGFRSVKNIITHNEVVKANGGQGAGMEGIFKIGTGPNDLKPGSNLRLVIGRAGESARNNGANVSSGGGGGTGLLYESPGARPQDWFYYPWKMLLVAGGGGGAQSDCCAVHDDGKHGETDEDGGGVTGYQGENGWACSEFRPAQKHDGRGYRADSDPEALDNGFFKNAEGAGFQEQNGFIVPTGGKVTVSQGFDGGYGFGGGGAYRTSDPFFEAPGGGGYSGGGHNFYRGGWGGGSFVNSNCTIAGTVYKHPNGTTGNSQNGFVEYQFTNTALASRTAFDFGIPSGSAKVLLQTGNYKLAWQTDGNLVLYDQGKAEWASHTNAKGATECSFQGDGNMVIYKGSQAIWSTGSNGKGAKKLVLTASGHLYIATADNQILWLAN